MQAGSKTPTRPESVSKALLRVTEQIENDLLVGLEAEQALEMPVSRLALQESVPQVLGVTAEAVLERVVEQSGRCPSVAA